MLNVREAIQNGSHVPYSAKLMSGSRFIEATCLVTPSALIVKKHRLFRAPDVVYTCRTSPSRKVELTEANYKRRHVIYQE